MIEFIEKKKKVLIPIIAIVFVILLLLPIITTKRVDIDKSYTTKEDVALYIMTYHELPKNYITKDGLTYAQNHSLSYSDKIVGGDTHWNTNELSSFGIKSNVILKECDIKGSVYYASNRGSLRLVYTCNTKNVRVFYTADHYGTYTEIAMFSLQLVRNIFWFVFLGYTIAIAVLFIVYKKKKSNKKQIET